MNIAVHPAESFAELLQDVKTVLVIDWPSKDVPEALARAGFRVVVHGGPGPEDYAACEPDGGEVASRNSGRQPVRADLLYSYRPFSELPGIIATALSLHAGILWTQSGLSGPGVKDPKGCWVAADELAVARNLAQAAGLRYFTEPYIGDAARAAGASR